jgi:hypothetical protein
MAILLYNFKEIVELWLTALGEVSVGRDNGESYKPLLEFVLYSLCRMDDKYH